MWAIAQATNAPNFEYEIKELSKVIPIAHTYLSKLPVKWWCRHAFGLYTKCDLLSNNMLEAFNSSILDAKESHYNNVGDDKGSSNDKDEVEV